MFRYAPNFWPKEISVATATAWSSNLKWGVAHKPNLNLGCQAPFCACSCKNNRKSPRLAWLQSNGASTAWRGNKQTWAQRDVVDDLSIYKINIYIYISIEFKTKNLISYDHHLIPFYPLLDSQDFRDSLYPIYIRHNYWKSLQAMNPGTDMNYKRSSIPFIIRFGFSRFSGFPTIVESPSKPWTLVPIYMNKRSSFDSILSVFGFSRFPVFPIYLGTNDWKSLQAMNPDKYLLCYPEPLAPSLMAGFLLQSSAWPSTPFFSCPVAAWQQTESNREQIESIAM